MVKESVSWKHYPLYLLLRFFCGIVRLIPRWLVWRLTSALSFLAYLVSGRRRRMAMENLDIAFGDDKTPAEKKRIVRGSFENLFLTAVEFIRIPEITKDVKSFMSISNYEAVRDALRGNRGLFFVTCHCGNWEIMAHRTIAEGCMLASIGRPLRNPLVYREIQRLRCYNGGASLKKKWITRSIIRSLRRNWGIAMLIDQYSGRRAPFVPFFGRPVSTTPAAVILAMKTGAALIPVFDVRTGYGRHHMHYCDRVEITDTGDKQSDVEETCARLNRALEKWIRKYPDQWLWMHRRWRRKKSPEEP